MSMRVLFVAAAVALWAAPATAAEPFPQWGFELRMGSYQPAVGDQTIPDTTRDESDYYKLYFGNDRPLMFAVEFDRYLAYLSGHLGFFLQIGLWKDSGRSRTCSDASGANIACTPQTVFDSSAGNDKTQLQIIPMTVGLIYRFDLAQRQWDVPLVPYGKLGFSSFYWRSTGGSGSLSTFSGGGDGSGWTMGMKAAAGLAINFAFLTPSNTIDHTIFVDSYFFAEIDYTWANGFGDDAKFDMSDTQVQFGVSFDFE